MAQKMARKMARKMTSPGGSEKGQKRAFPGVKNDLPKDDQILTKNREKNFAEICDVKKMLLIGRKKCLDQAPYMPWRVKNPIKKALWSPFLAHLYDSPPSHNFFQTGFRPKFSPIEKFLHSFIPKNAHFCKKKKIDPVS